MKITRREKEIIQLVAHEFTTKEIAAQLFISDETVTTHRKNLMEKLQAKNAAGLIRRGFESGLLRVAMCLLILIQSQPITYAQDLPIAIETDTSHAVRLGTDLEEDGNKLYWNPKKSILLAGNGTEYNGIGQFGLPVSTVYWHIPYIGDYSTSFGYLNQPYSWGTMTWGQNNVVRDTLGTSWGLDNEVSRDLGTAWGENNVITESHGTVWGQGNRVEGEHSTSWGTGNEVNSFLGTAWGGHNKSNGALSTVMGLQNLARTPNSLVIGTYCDTLQGDIDPDKYQLFVVGNGGVAFGRSNALSVFSDGSMKLGSGYSSSDLHITQSEVNINGGSGGIILEHTDAQLGHWQIYNSGSYLSFGRGQNRRAYIHTDGSYIDNESFLPEKEPITKSKLHRSSLQKLQIGIKTISKSNKEVSLNTAQFLQDFPEMVVYDEHGDPFGIDYRQLYLTAIAALQEEVILNSQQAKQIEQNGKAIAQLSAQLLNLQND